MKRHVSLRTLSSDHHHGLVQARRLARAAEGKAGVGKAANAYLEFAAGELARHFREEEEILLPEFALAAGADDLRITRVLREHLEIRARSLALGRALMAGEVCADELAQLGKALEAHIRFEERELFPAIEGAIPLERLAAVGVLLASGLE